ncbi:MAG: hypothetical protein O7A03_01450 [Alphaproteobacteria bacterium]|nr:hypothetical protein [Alphaproteobacteria bacterium]
MIEPLNRDNVIELLKKLGADQDEAVLEAARQVHAQITDAGMSWDDLLVPVVAADDGDDGDDGDDSDDGDDGDDGDEAEYQDAEDETPEPPANTAKKDADSLALIDELLAKSGISEDLRKELESYKTDIAKGEFEESDRRYVRAVHNRLSKRR